MRADSFQSLIASVDDSSLESLLKRAREATGQRFGRVMQLYAPLYLSNECVDTCTYCGFSLMNKIRRRTLTVDETVQETEFLIAQGFRHVLYVSGEHPAHVTPDYLAEVIGRVRPRLASVSIEVAPFHEAVYRRLIDAGLDGVVLYQETYDTKRYEEFHLAGPKKSYTRRLSLPEEAARAGIRQLGMGILLGLGDWRRDATALVDHIQRLRKRYWQTEFTVSLPRLRPCAADFQPPHPVSDRDFIQLIAALRLTLPEVGIVLSTREAPSLRDTLIGVGVTRMSAGSRTEPGGYMHPERSLKQFEIEDLRPPSEVARMITERGYEPVWKDWERFS